MSGANFIKKQKIEIAVLFALSVLANLVEVVLIIHCRWEIRWNLPMAGFLYYALVVPKFFICGHLMFITAFCMFASEEQALPRPYPFLARLAVALFALPLLLTILVRLKLHI